MSLGGFVGMRPREFFFKWGNLLRFGVYSDEILSLKNYHFLYKNLKNCNFILDTRLLWGNNYSRKEIFFKFMIVTF